MKFKHGMVMGVIGGFLMACVGVMQRDKEAVAERAIEDAEVESRWYNEGWIAGVDFFKTHHVVNHAGCTRCPH